MKALISTVEPVLSGYRVAQVEQDANIFPVAEGLFWTDCTDDVVADQFWYDPQTQQFKEINGQMFVAAQDQPTVDGAETL